MEKMKNETSNEHEEIRQIDRVLSDRRSKHLDLIDAVMRRRQLMPTTFTSDVMALTGWSALNVQKYVQVGTNVSLEQRERLRNASGRWRFDDLLSVARLPQEERDGAIERLLAGTRSSRRCAPADGTAPRTTRDRIRIWREHGAAIEDIARVLGMSETAVASEARVSTAGKQVAGMTQARRVISLVQRLDGMAMETQLLIPELMDKNTIRDLNAAWDRLNQKLGVLVRRNRG